MKLLLLSPLLLASVALGQGCSGDSRGRTYFPGTGSDCKCYRAVPVADPTEPRRACGNGETFVNGDNPSLLSAGIAATPVAAAWVDAEPNSNNQYFFRGTTTPVLRANGLQFVLNNRKCIYFVGGVFLSRNCRNSNNVVNSAICVSDELTRAEFGEFTEFSPCMAESCGLPGMRTRSRECVSPSECCASVPAEVETEECEIDTSDRNVVGDWEESDCSTTCGEGVQFRTRECLSACCDDSILLNQTLTCTIMERATAGDYDEWSGCECSTDSPVGATEFRERNLDPGNTGCPALGPNVEVRDCPPPAIVSMQSPFSNCIDNRRYREATCVDGCCLLEDNRIDFEFQTQCCAQVATPNFPQTPALAAGESASLFNVTNADTANSITVFLDFSFFNIDSNSAIELRLTENEAESSSIVRSLSGTTIPEDVSVSVLPEARLEGALVVSSDMTSRGALFTVSTSVGPSGAAGECPIVPSTS